MDHPRTSGAPATSGVVVDAHAPLLPQKLRGQAAGGTAHRLHLA